MTARIIAAFILCVTFGAAAARAQAPVPPTLTLSLDEAISRAIAQSHLIEETRARGDAAAAVTGQRHSALLPQVAGQAGYTRTNHVDEFGIEDFFDVMSANAPAAMYLTISVLPISTTSGAVPPAIAASSFARLGSGRSCLAVGQTR